MSQGQRFPKIFLTLLVKKMFQVDEIISILRTKGIYILNDFYNEEELKKLSEEFEKIFKTVKSEVLNKENCSKDERIFHAEKYSGYLREKFSDNKFFEEICRKYTDKKFKKKTLINRLKYEDGKIKNSGAGWHRDNHNCQFKLIMYLTDVTEKNGNFQWITNSSRKHIGYPKPRTLEYDTRYHDSTIDEIIKKDDCELINITGKKGTIILADTTFIHRGNIIQEGERKAITQYFF